MNEHEFEQYFLTPEYLDSVLHDKKAESLAIARQIEDDEYLVNLIAWKEELDEALNDAN